MQFFFVGVIEAQSAQRPATGLREQYIRRGNFNKGFPDAPDRAGIGDSIVTDVDGAVAGVAVADGACGE